MSSTQREVRYGEMSFAQLLFRYLWPFWLFRDATRGDRIARAAAYRHNRSMRIHLPAYLVRWMLGSALAYAMTARFDSLAGSMHARAASPDLFTLLTAGAGIVFVASLCVLLLTAYAYLYLCRHAE